MIETVHHSLSPPSQILNFSLDVKGPSADKNMAFLLAKPISDRGLRELDYYEYVGTDASILNNYVMQVCF